MSNLNGFVTTADEVASACDLMGRLLSVNNDKMGGAAMKVTYNGFTGELVKLERYCKSVIKVPVDGGELKTTNLCIGDTWDVLIFDKEKAEFRHFTGVKLEDVKLLGGAVTFGG